jgi:hypothetical protein
MPTDVSAVVHRSQQKALRVMNSGKLRGSRTELG